MHAFTDVDITEKKKYWAGDMETLYIAEFCMQGNRSLCGVGIRTDCANRICLTILIH